MSQKTEIEFEDNYHYPYSLTENNFHIIDTQDKMDNIYSIIHKKNGGKRLAPIPTVTDEETFIIIKPLLKNANDVSVAKVTFDNETLYIKIKEFNNPSIDVKNRQSPNILLKLLKKISAKKVITQY
ncbi:hypothetical protein [Chryseobacterium aquaticum]|uniref:Uncharacterized protein n=1 Tax=Chryseobacterium aquaticum subsp. greenlandense TaxID=345663 RepID=A0A124F380_9FLAO|nr:hypothetical protein [Chryseobacterium aquaticum]KUJ57106.1 hypothetical protein AR686_05425 [Chryseobacterium aquaticum subsp. greenlandense]